MAFFVVEVVRTQNGYIESISVSAPCDTAEEAKRQADVLPFKVRSVVVEADDHHLAIDKALGGSGWEPGSGSPPTR